MKGFHYGWRIRNVLEHLDAHDDVEGLCGDVSFCFNHCDRIRRVLPFKPESRKS